MIAIPLLLFTFIKRAAHSLVQTIEKPTNNFQLHLKSNIYSFNYLQLLVALRTRLLTIIHTELWLAVFFPRSEQETVCWLFVCVIYLNGSEFSFDFDRMLSQFFPDFASACTVIFIIDFSHLSSTKIVFQRIFFMILRFYFCPLLLLFFFL